MLLKRAGAQGHLLTGSCSDEEASQVRALVRRNKTSTVKIINIRPHAITGSIETLQKWLTAPLNKLSTSLHDPYSQ